HVHDDPCACERFGQPLTGDGVDAGGRGSRHNLVPALAKERHELLPDEPTAADHYDLHVGPPCLWTRVGGHYSTSATDQRDSLSGVPGHGHRPEPALDAQRHSYFSGMTDVLVVVRVKHNSDHPRLVLVAGVLRDPGSPG